MADPVEIDMERKEELIMAKKLRACRVTILPKAPGKCFIPEVVQPKPKSKREPLQISMKQAAAKPPPGAPSPAAIAAATNPVALRYWNQCLANSSKGPLTVPKDETSVPLLSAPLPTQQDTTFPPWVTPETPLKVEKSEVGAKPNIVVPDMTRRIARPLSHPTAQPGSISTRRGSANSAVLDAVLSEEGEKANPPFPRFQKPWQLHNQRQPTFAHHIEERKPKTMSPKNAVTGAKTRSCQLQKKEHFSQHKDASDIELINPPSHHKAGNIDLAKKEKPENKSGTFMGENVFSGSVKKEEKSEFDRAQSLTKNSQPSKETVFTSSESIICEESERVERNGISGVIDREFSSEEGGAGSVEDVGPTIMRLLEGIPRSEHPALLGLLLCALPTDSMLELLSNLLSKEHLGAIILKAMCEKSRRDLILRFVNDDPVLKDKIIQGEASHTLDVKRNGEFSEDDGFGSERVDSSEEKLVLSDSSEGEEPDKEVMMSNLKELATATSDYGPGEMKEEHLYEETSIPKDNLAKRNSDPDLNSQPIDSGPGEIEQQETLKENLSQKEFHASNEPEDSYSSETKVSEKKKEQPAQAS